MNMPEGENLLRKLKTALNLVSVQLPFLDSLARIAQYCFDSRTRTAAVFRSGRIVINPVFFDCLSVDERVFVIAHELMHLQMQSHDRLGDTGTLGNIAHDLIINDLLHNELRFIPSWVLRQDRASEHSVERLVGALRGMQDPLPERSFNWPEQPASGRPRSNLARALADSGVTPFSELDRASLDADGTKYDLGSDGLEAQLFESDDGKPPRSSNLKQAKGGGDVYVQSKTTPPGAHRVATVAISATAQEVIALSLDHDRDSREPNHWLRAEKTHAIARLRESCDTPFEVLAQAWIDSHLPSRRSFARPSRRAGDRSDVVLPGRLQESTIINVVLDTSGSMWELIPSILSLIAESAVAAGVMYLRVIQCDIDVTRDDVIQVDERDEFVVSGFRNWEGQHVSETPEPEKEEKSDPNKPSPATPKRPREQPTPVKRSASGYSYSAQRSWFPDYAYRGRRPFGSRRVVRSSKKMSKLKTHLFPVPNHPQAKPLEAPRRYQAAPDSNLVPAIMKLDHDPSVTSAIVITDGIVDIPANSPRIELLWVVINNDSFAPEYGTIARITVKKG